MYKEKYFRNGDKLPIGTILSWERGWNYTVVSVVEDVEKGVTLHILRAWSKYKQRYFYEMRYSFDIDLLFERKAEKRYHKIRIPKGEKIIRGNEW